MDKYKLDDAYKKIGKLTVDLEEAKELELKFRKWWLEEKDAKEAMAKELEDYLAPKDQDLVKAVVLQIKADMQDTSTGEQLACLKELVNHIPTDILQKYLPVADADGYVNFDIDTPGADFDIDKPL